MKTNRLSKWTSALMMVVSVFDIISCQSQPIPSADPVAVKTLVPNKAWPCGMPEGIPVPERGVSLFEATIKLDQIYDLGRTPYGHRKVAAVQSGIFAGPKLTAVVMAGSLDFELSQTNGTLEIEQVLVLKTEDGKFIYVRNAGTASNPSDVRMVLDFEAPTASTHSWLNSGKYVGRRVIDLIAKTIKLSVFDVSGVTNTMDASMLVRVAKPEGVPDQPWDYRRAAANEKRAGQLITENVTLGGSQSVGATKNGGRNIIPITGGTVTGKINGKVLSGGADYQKMANPFTLDARYLWQTEEGDVIIVRNAGPVSSLVPVFELGVDSKYAWLNKGTYMSSGPSMGAGGVSLNFFESSPQ